MSGRGRQPSHREVAVAALLDEADRMLLVRTNKLPKHWQPPGGGVDPEDSSPVAALRREIDEELGISIDPRSLDFQLPINTPSDPAASTASPRESSGINACG